MLQPKITTNTLTIIPFLRLSFRPFFLLAAMFSIVSIGLWLSFLNGVYQWQSLLPVTIWHGHEMIFAFAATVAIGFLLTAAQTWTGIKSISGWPLLILVLLWITARIALFSDSTLFFYLGVGAETGWWLIAIGYLSYMFIKSNNQRNMIFIPILSTLMVIDALILINGIRANILQANYLSYCAVLLITMIVTIIGGRVIPFFTTNGLNLKLKSADSWSERATALFMLLSFLSFSVNPLFDTHLISPAFMIITGLLQINRMKHWQSTKTFQTPLLWSLHFAYFNLGLGYILLGGSYYFTEINFLSALHVLTIGTIGTMILAMMSRVSLGHTGRPLQANKWIALSFVLILISALFRFLLPLFGFVSEGYLLSGITWILAFSLFVVFYTPILIKARIDSRAG